jgi:hypothetical protein
MKWGLTTLTRGVVCLMGFAVFVVCAMLLPEIAREEAQVDPTGTHLVYPFLLFAWALSVPIFVALYHTMKLLRFIDRGTAFSGRSVNALQYIKTCAVVFGALLIMGVAAVVILSRSTDPREDVTPLISLGGILVLISSIIATFKAVLQKLLRNAIAIKSENDLTV